jgi:hypothetical protein
VSLDPLCLQLALWATIFGELGSQNPRGRERRGGDGAEIWWRRPGVVRGGGRGGSGEVRVSVSCYRGGAALVTSPI